MLHSSHYYSKIVQEIGILQNLAPYEALWVGSIPIDVHVENSDVDIICCLKEGLEKTIQYHFSNLARFRIRKSQKCLISSFTYKGVPFEIYAEEKVSKEQLGYLHMVAESNLLRFYGDMLRKKVRRLKREGVKTERAFAEILGLNGDPYLALLRYVDFLPDLD